MNLLELYANCSPQVADSRGRPMGRISLVQFLSDFNPRPSSGWIQEDSTFSGGRSRLPQKAPNSSRALGDLFNLSGPTGERLPLVVVVVSEVSLCLRRKEEVDRVQTKATNINNNNNNHVAPLSRRKQRSNNTPQMDAHFVR